MSTRWVVGIDEVGRGALAGPVTVAVTMLALDAHGRVAHAPLRSLKDSKKLTARQREVWALALTEHPGVRFAIARVYPRSIEKLNISGAANRAASRAYGRLLKKYDIPQDTRVYLDGGLFLESKTQQRQAVAEGTLNALTLAKADENIPAVAAASILAKVSRDRFMNRLGKQFPCYGFEIHKGYGTAAHRQAIKKNGRCAAHRLTFLIKQPIINK